jgi:hypothetical protein
LARESSIATGCASVGGCANSTANGGAGCDLCDRVARLPQPRTARALPEAPSLYELETERAKPEDRRAQRGGRSRNAGDGASQETDRVK